MKNDNHFLSTEVIGDLNAPIPWWTWVVPIFIQVLGRIVSPFLTVSPGIYLLYLPYLTGVPLVLWWGPRVLIGVWISSFFGAWLVNFPREVILFLGIAEVSKVGIGYLSWKYLKIYQKNLKNTSGIFYCWLLTFALPNFIGSYLLMAILTVGGVYRGHGFLSGYFSVTLIDTFMGLLVSFPCFIVMSHHMFRKGWTNWQSSPFE